MPYISINQKEFHNLLTICNQVSPKKSDIEIFTFTKIVIYKEKIIVSCINSNYYFESELEPSSVDLSEDSVSFLIKTDVLSSSIAMIFDEIVGIDLNLENSTIILQGSQSKHTLRIDTHQINDFIAPQKKPDELKVKLSAKTSELIPANKSSLISVGNPRTVYQPEFLSVCYSLLLNKNKIAVVSTDRYRIVKSLVDADFFDTAEDIKDSERENFLINPKGLQLLNSISGEPEKIDLHFENDFLWIIIGKSKLVLRYGEGKYPDYEKIIPKSFSCSFLLNTNEALSALKQVYVSARSNINNKSINIKVEPEKSKVTFTANSVDGNNSESVINLSNYEGSSDSWEQAFNADYLLDYFNTVKSENILWESNPGKPSVISPENEKERQLYLVSGLK